MAPGSHPGASSAKFFVLCGVVPYSRGEEMIFVDHLLADGKVP